MSAATPRVTTSLPVSPTPVPAPPLEGGVADRGGAPMPQRGDVILDVRDLCTYFYTYDGVVRALDGVSFKVRRGETVGMAGETGCGKSVTASQNGRSAPACWAPNGGFITTKSARPCQSVKTFQSRCPIPDSHCRSASSALCWAHR